MRRCRQDRLAEGALLVADLAGLDAAAELGLDAEVARRGALPHGVTESTVDVDQRKLTSRPDLRDEGLYDRTRRHERRGVGAFQIRGRVEQPRPPRGRRDAGFDDRRPSARPLEEALHVWTLAGLGPVRWWKRYPAVREIAQVDLVHVPEHRGRRVPERGRFAVPCLDPVPELPGSVVIVPGGSQDHEGAVRLRGRDRVPRRGRHAGPPRLQLFAEPRVGRCDRIALRRGEDHVRRGSRTGSHGTAGYGRGASRATPGGFDAGKLALPGSGPYLWSRACPTSGCLPPTLRVRAAGSRGGPALGRRGRDDRRGGSGGPAGRGRGGGGGRGERPSTEGRAQRAD